MRVSVTSMVAQRDKSPQVTIAVGERDFAVQCTPDEARDLARSLFEAATNAETDAAIYAFVAGEGGGERDAARAIMLVRSARERAGRG